MSASRSPGFRVPAVEGLSDDGIIALSYESACHAESPNSIDLEPPATEQLKERMSEVSHLTSRTCLLGRGPEFTENAQQAP